MSERETSKYWKQEELKKMSSTIGRASLFLCLCFSPCTMDQTRYTYAMSKYRVNLSLLYYLKTNVVEDQKFKFKATVLGPKRLEILK